MVNGKVAAKMMLKENIIWGPCEVTSLSTQKTNVLILNLRMTKDVYLRIIIHENLMVMCQKCKGSEHINELQSKQEQFTSRYN